MSPPSPGPRRWGPRARFWARSASRRRPGTPNPLYSREGVIALLALQHTPLVFLLVFTALRTLPREMVEAARVAGARPLRILRRVILPLLAPALIAAAALAFVAALGNFGIPALLGIPGRYTTLPVLIWQRLSSFGPGMLPAVAVLSALMAAVALAAVALQLALAGRARTRLTGPPQAPLRFALGRWRPVAEARAGAHRRGHARPAARRAHRHLARADLRRAAQRPRP
jgi:iron(III) transport system permease protein